MKVLQIHQTLEARCRCKEEWWNNTLLGVRRAQPPPSYSVGSSWCFIFIGYPPASTMYQPFSQDAGTHTMPLLVKPQWENQMQGSFGEPNSTSNTRREFGACYSTKHVPRSLPPASWLPFGSQALLRLSPPSWSHRTQRPRADARGEGCCKVKARLGRLLVKPGSGKLFPLASFQ